MPVLEDGRLVADPWIVVEDEAPLPDAPSVLSLARLKREQLDLIGRNAPLGVRLKNDERVDDLAPLLPRLALVQVEMPKSRDGRAFTQARALREYHGFTGEIRAAGHVIPDHYAMLLRCGVTSVVVPEGADVAVWDQARRVIPIAYQHAVRRDQPISLQRRRLALGALAAAALLGTRGAQARPARAAQDTTWPDRSIRLIVPVAAGGSQDIVARLLARHLTDALGQNVVVENHPGAGSNIGYELAARSKPDGYTLLAGSDSLSINKALFPRLSFDPVADFDPVARAVRVPQILVVRADSAVQTLEQFIDTARRQPVAVGTPGNGSLAHLLGEIVQNAGETRWTHAPYRGGALAVNDLLGGSLQGVLINIGAVTDHVRSGRMRGIFVSSAVRTAALPQVPTLAEAGLTGAEVVGWHGIVAPAGTDPALRARLNAEITRILDKPDVAERIAALGMDAVRETPAATAALMRADAERWAGLVRQANLRPD